MARSRSMLALLVLAAGAALPAGAVSAHPSTPSTLTYQFTACTGPAGTPTQFDAVKQPGEGAALHLSDGSGVFIAVEAVDEETDTVLFTTPGFQQNDLPTVTCSVLNPRNDRQQVVTGLIVPLG
jgi:hypothetical protein